MFHQLAAVALLAASAAAPSPAPKPNLCAMVTAADVKGVIGDPVSSAQALEHTLGCRYETGKAAGTVTLNFLNTGGDARAEFEAQARLQSTGGKTDKVTDLGDEAVFGMVLVVRRGDRVLMVDPQPLPEKQRREQAIALARLALARVP